MIITHHYHHYFYDCNQNALQMALSAVADMALSCPLCAWIHRRIQVNYLAAGKHYLFPVGVLTCSQRVICLTVHHEREEERIALYSEIALHSLDSDIIKGGGGGGYNAVSCIQSCLHC